MQSYRSHSRSSGILLLVITAILWSTSGLGIKAISWHPLAIAGARSGIAALVIAFAFRRIPICHNRRLYLGGFAYGIMMFTFVAANKLTTAANAILLQYTNPVYVAILGTVFLKEKPRLADWITMAIVGSGIILFFQDQMQPGGIIGNLLAIASGIAMAVMIVSMRSQKNESPHGTALLGNILTFVFGIPFFFDGSPSSSEWVIILALGTIQTGLSYALYSIAITRVTALEASIITIIEPLLNPIWVFLLAGEQPGPWALGGGSIIIIALAFRYICLPNQPLSAESTST